MVAAAGIARLAAAAARLAAVVGVEDDVRPVVLRAAVSLHWQLREI